MLVGIDTVETLADALSQRAELAEGRSIITREGVWVARDWVLMPDSDAGQIGVIERQKKWMSWRSFWRKRNSLWKR